MGKLCALSLRCGRAERIGAETYPVTDNHVSGYFVRPHVGADITGKADQSSWALVPILSLMVVASSFSRSHAQARPPWVPSPPLRCWPASTVTNTGPTTLTGTAALPGDVGVFPGNTFTGAGSVTFATGGVQHLGDAVATAGSNRPLKRVQ